MEGFYNTKMKWVRICWRIKGRQMMIKELMIAKGHLCLHANCQRRFTKKFSTGESAPWRQKTKKETLHDILDILSNQRWNALIFSQLYSVPRIFNILYCSAHTKHDQYKRSPVGSSGRKRNPILLKTWLLQIYYSQDAWGVDSDSCSPFCMEIFLLWCGGRLHLRG